MYTHHRQPLPQEVTIGIMYAPQVHLHFNTPYTAKGQNIQGKQHTRYHEGTIEWNGNLYRELTLTPLKTQDNPNFTIKNVPVGKNFHWQHTQNQTFTGTLKLIVEENKILCINIVPVEHYIASVISSEMNSQAPIEFLKAAAIVSRSWLFTQIIRRKQTDKQPTPPHNTHNQHDTTIKWRDNNDHTTFDVCADDHCQRYKGITTPLTPTALHAVHSTHGEIMTHNGQICDARFSKCCGGATEEFSHCWDDYNPPYLRSITDGPGKHPDLTDETTARQWITTPQNSYCNTTNPRLLKQLLTPIDIKTTNFYRWTQTYTQKQIATLLQKNTKTDFGQIKDLIPQTRGPGGHISTLKIVGTHTTHTIGKELQIRRILSTTHLLSSAFVVDKEPADAEIPARFHLHGAGWGHGVGMCQIGAANMAAQGFDCHRILQHYYTHITFDKAY